MRPKFQRYAVTLIAFAILALSLGIMALGSYGVVPTGNTWRTLIIPGYLTLLISAVLATTLSISNSALLWPVSFALTLLPFVALDWLRSRFHRPDALNGRGDR